MFLQEYMLIPILSKIKYTKTFTMWNIIFSILGKKLKIPQECLLLNSINTWVSFQHGATDGTKLRLMKKFKIKSIYTFLFGDIIQHTLPVIIWSILTKGKIKEKHIFRQLSWVIMYYIIVGNGFNCEKQYCKYPYKRQVFSALVTPFIFSKIWNHSLNKSKIPLLIFFFYVYYMKEVYDLYDEKKNLEKHFKSKKTC